MRNKAYSESNKRKYDNNGKRITEEILRDTANASLVGDNVKEDSGDFSDGFWDQKYKLKSGEEFKTESEMKDKKWWGKYYGKNVPFKYDTMDIPFRKAKNQAEVHFVISTCQQYAFSITRKSMDQAFNELGGKPKIKSTKNVPSGEPFFSTPVDRGRFFYKDGKGKWKIVKET
jgi:hypothetical protein